MFKKKKTRDFVTKDEKPSKLKKERTRKNDDRDLPKLSFNDILSNRKIIGVTLIILAGVISFIVIPTINVMSAGSIEVVVAKSDLRVGDRISSEDLTTVEVGKFGLDNVITDKSLVVGKYLTVDMQSGDYVTARKVTDYYVVGEKYLAYLEPGMQAISVRTSSLELSLSSNLQSGDIVKIYSTSKSDGNVVTFNALEFPELTYLEVLAVTNADGVEITPNSNLDNQVTETVILKVYDKQANILTALNSNSTMHFSLVSRGNNDYKEQLLQQQYDYLFPPVIEEVIEEDTEEQASEEATDETS